MSRWGSSEVVDCGVEAQGGRAQLRRGNGLSRTTADQASEPAGLIAQGRIATKIIIAVKPGNRTFLRNVDEQAKGGGSCTRVLADLVSAL